MRKFVNVKSFFAHPDDGTTGTQDYDEKQFMKGI